MHTYFVIELEGFGESGELDKVESSQMGSNRSNIGSLLIAALEDITLLTTMNDIAHTVVVRCIGQAENVIWANEASFLVPVFPKPTLMNQVKIDDTVSKYNLRIERLSQLFCMFLSEVVKDLRVRLSAFVLLSGRQPNERALGSSAIVVHGCDETERLVTIKRSGVSARFLLASVVVLMTEHVHAVLVAGFELDNVSRLIRINGVFGALALIRSKSERVLIAVDRLGQILDGHLAKRRHFTAQVNAFAHIFLQILEVRDQAWIHAVLSSLE